MNTIETLKELLKLAHESLDSKDFEIAELKKTMDGICVAVFDNRGKAVTEKTLVLVRVAVNKFNLPLDIK
jgi:hypothetical protein